MTIVWISVAAVVVWILLILVLLRYHRQRVKLQRAKMMVIAHQGDIQFGDPELMAKGGDDSFTGGEIDPATGEITLYKTGGQPIIDSLAPGTVRMPAVWGGNRANPIAGVFADVDADADADADSLGNLSEFEDADFEAFADSLLDDRANDDLFGYNQTAARLPQESLFKNPPLADLDSLSDFENDEDDILGPGYLHMEEGHTENEPSPDFIGDATHTLRGTRHHAHAQVQDRISTTSESLDGEIVVADTSYEDVAQTWGATMRRGVVKFDI